MAAVEEPGPGPADATEGAAAELAAEAAGPTEPAAEGAEEAAVAEAAPPEPRPLGRGELPPIPRNTGYPALADLPERLRKGLEEPVRTPRIRLIIFYGAGDLFASWAPAWLAEAPEWAEVAVHEARGHGLREGEDFDESIEARADDAWRWLRPVLLQHLPFGEAPEAPVALLGHSLGCQVLTLVAKRMRDELSIEPVAVFVMDRPPPNIRLMSEFGYKMCIDDPLAFFEWFDPTTGRMMRAAQGTEGGEKLMQRWQGTFIKSYQEYREEGYHTFDCNINVFIAADGFESDKLCKKNKMTPDEKKAYLDRGQLFSSSPDSGALYDEKQYALWRRWTSKSCGLVKLNTSHAGVRLHEEAKKIVWRELRRFVS